MTIKRQEIGSPTEFLDVAIPPLNARAFSREEPLRKDAASLGIWLLSCAIFPLTEVLREGMDVDVLLSYVYCLYVGL
jgi:hypothetical protein